MLAQIPTPCDAPVLGEVCDAADGAIDAVAGAPGAAVGAVSDSVFGEMAERFADGASEMLVAMTTLWLDAPASSGVSATAINDAAGFMRPLTILLASIGLMIGGVRLAIDHTAGRTAMSLGMGVARLVVIASGGTAMVLVGLEASDEMSAAILSGADVRLSGEVLGFGVLAPGLLMLFSLFTILMAAMQIGFLLFRSAALMLVAAVWPVAAGAAVIPGADHTLRRLSGWIVALLLYKPAAALCYALSFRLLSNETPGVMSAVTGLLMLGLSLMALPGLIKLIVPAAASMGGPSTASAVGSAAGMATGAVMLASGTGMGMAAGGAASGAAGSVSGAAGAAGSAGGAASSAGGMVPSGAAAGGSGPMPSSPTGSASGGNSPSGGGAGGREWVPLTPRGGSSGNGSSAGSSAEGEADGPSGAVS